MPRSLSPVLALILVAVFAPSAHAAKSAGVTTKVSKKTLTITGSKKADKIVVRVRKRQTRTLEIDVKGSSRAEFSLARRRFTKIVIRAGKGNDTVTLDERNGVFTTAERTTLKGDAGSDRLTVFGSAGADAIAVARSGTGVQVVRGTKPVVTSTTVETLNIAPLAGGDTVVVNDLRGTALTNVGIDFARTAGGATGDGAADRLLVGGGVGNDAIAVSGDGGSAAVAGLGPAIAATRVEPAADTLTVGGGGGADKIDASALGAGALKVATDGGPGDDTLTGSNNADTLSGGDGNDTASAGAGNDTADLGPGNDSVSGGDGDDTLSLGAGDDTATGDGGNDSAALGAGDDIYSWKAGDGTDVVDGGGGNDRINAAATGDADELTIGDDAGRVRVARGIDAVLGDSVETADLTPGGGADRVAVADLRGTDTGRSVVNFGDDGQVDELAVSGGSGDDAIGSEGGDTLTGIGRITATGGDGGADKLSIATGGGNDSVDASGLGSGRFTLSVDSGEGDDTVIPSDGNDAVTAGPGDDTVAARPGGSDTLEGGDGTDRLLVRGTDDADQLRAIGSAGRIQVQASGVQVGDAGAFEKLGVQPLGGADRVELDPSLAGVGVTTADADLAVGGAGDSAADVVTVSGTENADNVPITSDGSGAHVRGIPVALDVTGSEATDQIGINALGGADTVDGSAVAAGVIGLAIDGGPLADVLLGTPNNDSVVGGNGNDVAFLRGGDDSFRWDPGDGSDTIEGQTGTDTLQVNGANIAENFDIAANGGRVLLVRNVGTVTLDADDVDVVSIAARGGVDNVTTGDLTGTDLKKVNADLATDSAGAGDGALDTVTVNGSQAADTPVTSGDATGVHVTGLAAAVDVTGFEPTDRLAMNLQGGADVYNASALAAGVITHTVNGGLGADVVFGSAGEDLVTGGDGDDSVFLGAADDTAIWNPGDDNDTIEGQDGSDTLRFNGANIAEKIVASANGGRVLFTRDVAAVTMDLNDVERIDFNALGGADQVTVNDLSGTDVTRVVVDLAGGGGADDGAADTVIQNATAGDDVVNLDDFEASVFTSGLHTRVDVVHPEAANDRLTFNALAGDDVVDMSRVPAGLINLTGDGGNDDDVLIGSDGADMLFGGAGDDVLIGGPGTDVLDGGTGTNTLIQ